MPIGNTHLHTSDIFDDFPVHPEIEMSGRYGDRRL